MIMGPAGEINYTRDGSFKIGITEAGKILTTAEGYPVLDETGEPVLLDFDVSRLNVSQNGELSFLDEEGVKP